MARSKSKPRTRKDRRTLTSLGKLKVNPNDPTLRGQIFMTVCSLIKPYPGTNPEKRLVDILKATEKQKEMFLQAVAGGLMSRHDTPLAGRSAPLDKDVEYAKQVISSSIASVWGIDIAPDTLELPKQQWENLEDLKLPCSVKDLPKAQKLKKEESAGGVEEVEYGEDGEDGEDREAEETEYEYDESIEYDEEGDEESNVAKNLDADTFEGELETLFEGNEFDEYDK